MGKGRDQYGLYSFTHLPMNCFRRDRVHTVRDDVASLLCQSDEEIANELASDAVNVVPTKIVASTLDNVLPHPKESTDVVMIVRMWCGA